ncbi:MAG: 3-keto-5-aminohexanoate cleavage protein [Rhodobacteraceae bacterium]|nr:3-keto-5-aminohexanoate cleavage protein [Paracoccaceae bacterium]
MKPVIIAAPNGARRSKAEHPALPITIEEITAEAVACQRAGAAVLHLHVRDSEGMHSLDAGLYRAATALIAERAPDLVVQITTEAAGIFGLEAQISSAMAVQPEAISVAWREFSPESNPQARRFYDWAAEAGVRVQHILYSSEDMRRFNAFGLEDQSILLVLGSYTGMEARVEDLPAYLAGLGAVRDWSVCAFGRNEHAVVRAALKAGGHGRVGFENNLRLKDGRLASGTAALVGQFRQPLASANDVRQLWRLGLHG